MSLSGSEDVHAHVDGCFWFGGITRRERNCAGSAHGHQAGASRMLARCPALLPQGSRRRQRRAAMPPKQAHELEFVLQEGVRKPRTVTGLAARPIPRLNIVAKMRRI